MRGAVRWCTMHGAVRWRGLLWRGVWYGIILHGIVWARQWWGHIRLAQRGVVNVA